ncbi:MAG TPA: DUF429 domain-containing protein [Acidilobales archaeon]|nr:DUF429 domain-containing protein [Acidilobales archaeon]
MVIVSGLDLSGTSRSISGFVVISDAVVIYVGSLRTNEEILDKVKEFMPEVIAIDAPLSHAPGYRKIDLRLRSLGFKVLPPGWRGMKKLIDRALILKEAFEDLGIKVIETHPSSAIKSSGLKSWEELLNLGMIKLAHDIRPKNKDEVDALIAATVAYFYVKGNTLVIKDVDGEVYLLPKLKHT